MGLFSLLDEESRFPQSSDLTLLEKLDKNFSKKAQFKRPKSQQFRFNIMHYAGAVSILWCFVETRVGQKYTEVIIIYTLY